MDSWTQTVVCVCVRVKVEAKEWGLVRGTAECVELVASSIGQHDGQRFFPVLQLTSLNDRLKLLRHDRPHQLYTPRHAMSICFIAFSFSFLMFLFCLQWFDTVVARDSEWQWHQLGRMQVCTSLQTGNHASTSPLSFSNSLDAFLRIVHVRCILG